MTPGPPPRYGRLGGIQPRSPVMRNYPLIVITVILVLVTLHLAKPVALPIALGIFGFLLLNPLVEKITRTGMPRPVAVVALHLAILAGLAALAVATADPLIEWFEGLPQDVRAVRADLLELSRPLAEARKSARTLGDLSELGGDDSYKVEVAQPNWVESLLKRGPLMLVALAIAGFLTLLLLLTARHSVDVVRQTPLSPGARRRLTVCMGRAQRDVSRYLGWLFLINTGLGVIVAITMASLGLEDPFMWGLMAGVANFVPYVGPLAVLVGVWIAGVVQFDGVLVGSWPALAFLILTSLEGQLVTPALLGRHLSLPPPLIFVAILIFGWSWGLVGAFLAVPALVTGKAVLKYWPSESRSVRVRPMTPVPAAPPSHVPDAGHSSRLPAA